MCETTAELGNVLSTVRTGRSRVPRVQLQPVRPVLLVPGGWGHDQTADRSAKSRKYTAWLGTGCVPSTCMNQAAAKKGKLGYVSGLLIGDAVFRAAVRKLF